MGGDLYDAFMVDEHRLCFLLGDVTGKGLAASLFMALAKAMSRSQLMQPGADLAQSMGTINHELNAENGQNMQLLSLIHI